MERDSSESNESVSDHGTGRVTVLNGLSSIAITDNDLSVRICEMDESVSE